MRVVGLDVSLTSTGVATIVAVDRIVVRRVASKGSKDASLDARSRRLDILRRTLCQVAAGADLVVIEGPSFGQTRQGGQHDRAGLWWLVVGRLVESHGITVVEVPPACVKKYATGKGNASKDQVLAAVVRRYPDVDVSGNDEADALVLAAMGARHLGHPIEDTLPLVNLAALAGVRWPS